MKLTTFVALAATAVSVQADTWKITDISKGERENLCPRQIQACQNDCGGPDQAPMAFCNPDTLAWGCGCLTKTPDLPKWDWPVPARDCAGSRSTCESNCNKEPGSKRDSCFKNCSETHKCNTEDAPVSYTETKDVEAVPKYSGPAVSYKGKKLGDLNDGNSPSNSDDKSDDDSSEDKSDKSDDDSSEDKSDKSDDDSSEDKSDKSDDDSSEDDKSSEDKSDSSSDDSGVGSIKSFSGIAIAAVFAAFSF